MDILILIKQVPDTETTIKVSGGNIADTGIKWIISPYDEVALEEGMRIKEKNGGTVTVISLGPERVTTALRTAYAMGADNAIHIKTDEYDVLDALTTAQAIHKATEEKKFDIILAGRQGIDSDNGQVPLIFAVKKDIAAIIWANKIEVSGNSVSVTSEVEGGEATYEAALPAVITTQIGMNEPRYPSLKGIMVSKKKPIETIALSDLGINVGENLDVTGYELPPQRPTGHILEGDDTAQKAGALLKALREDVKVI